MNCSIILDLLSRTSAQSDRCDTSRITCTGYFASAGCNKLPLTPSFPHSDHNNLPKRSALSPFDSILLLKLFFDSMYLHLDQTPWVEPSLTEHFPEVFPQWPIARRTVSPSPGVLSISDNILGLMLCWFGTNIPHFFNSALVSIVPPRY